MFLIAQYKVLAYINQHPEARVLLMLWFNTLESFSGTSTSNGGGKSVKIDKTSLTIHSELKDKLASLDINPANLVYFKTKDDYETGLKSATRLFSKRLNSTDFSNLCTLLPAIDDYENKELNWPKVENYEYVKIRMDLLQMTYPDFRDIIPQESDFQMYLSGELNFNAAILKRLYTRVQLRFLLKIK